MPKAFIATSLKTSENDQLRIMPLEPYNILFVTYFKVSYNIVYINRLKWISLTLIFLLIVEYDKYQFITVWIKAIETQHDGVV